MASLPLVDPTALTTGDLPVRSSADVLAVLPAKYRRPLLVPVRDALVAALTAICLEWQRRSAHAAGQSDVSHATERYLQGLGEDRVLAQAATEPEEAYRARLLGAPSLVTRTAILAICNAALAPYTSIKARVFESILDRMYVDDGSASAIHGFVEADPSYLDRMYPDDSVANGGFVRPQSCPFGAWCFLDSVGRQLVVELPDVSPIADARAYVYDATPIAIDGDIRSWVSDGTNPSGSEADGSVITFVGSDLQTAIDLYQSIADSINTAIGSGIRFTLFVEPAMT